MENLFGEILKAAFEGRSQEEMAKRVLETVDSDVDIEYHRRKGEDTSEVNIKGSGICLMAALSDLLEDIAMMVRDGNKKDALNFIDKVCRVAKYSINNKSQKEV